MDRLSYGVSVDKQSSRTIRSRARKSFVFLVPTRRALARHRGDKIIGALVHVLGRGVKMFYDQASASIRLLTPPLLELRVCFEAMPMVWLVSPPPIPLSTTSVTASGRIFLKSSKLFSWAPSSEWSRASYFMQSENAGTKLTWALWRIPHPPTESLDPLNTPYPYPRTLGWMGVFVLCKTTCTLVYYPIWWKMCACASFGDFGTEEKRMKVYSGTVK